MSDGTYKVVLTFAPDSRDDRRPWRARVYLNGPAYSEAPVEVCWGDSRDTALAKARAWIRAQQTHSEPETLLLDTNGDLIKEPRQHSVKVWPPPTEARTTGTRG